MPDWKEFVLGHLPSLQLDAAREQEIVEELAQQLEQEYSEALARGATRAEAEERAMAQFTDWDSLAKDIHRAERPVVARTPELLRNAM
jgi:hypothetical protein